MALLRSLALLAAVIASPAAAMAQAAPTCTESAARARSGAPSDDDLAVLLKCDTERGPAYAALLKRLATERDTVKLQGPFWGANLLRDGLVYTALQEIAADPTATIPARVYSIIALIFHERGSTGLTYREATSVSNEDACSIGGIDGIQDAIDHGAPLPADHQQRSNILARRLQADPTAPAPVQSAARCLFVATGGAEDELARLSSQPVNWAAIELTYVCGNRFRARNSNRRDVEVQFKVENPNRRGRILLPRNVQSEGGYAEITFSAPGSGTIHFISNGTVMKTARNLGIPCS